MTGRTEPSASARARSRTVCCWAKPGTVRRVQPPETAETMSATAPAGTVRPTFAAALSHPSSGLRTAAGGVPVVLAIEEET